MKFENLKFWFIVGSQFLYGPEALKEVEENSKTIVDGMNASGILPSPIEFKTLVLTNDDALNIVKEANYDDNCAGVIVFMHTFSPSKMWINALKLLQKPYLHYHSQFLDYIPNEEIDMDYMNLHQSAHGDREHAFMAGRLGLARKLVVGHWKDEDALFEIAEWMRAAAGAAFSKQLRLVRFGDNMRQVGVTEGDKILVQSDLGWQVNTWAVGDLVSELNKVTDEEIDAQMNIYKENYELDTDDLDSVRYQAKEQVAIQKLLEEQGANAFSDTFEDLYGLEQLPGLAVQDLMRQGYGFAGEGDWKTAALQAIIKFMATGMSGGTAFMEDYTYDFQEGLALGAHMLEVDPTVANETAKIQVHELGIGGKAAPARLVFEGKAGDARLVSIIDMGGRLRMVVHEVECVLPPQTMPNLPTARVMWKAKPNLEEGAKLWMLTGGAHHSVLTYDVSANTLRDWARIMNIEFIHIDENTKADDLEKDLLYSDIIWNLKKVSR